MSSIEKSTGKIVSGPDLVSRGFVYVRESEELMEESRALMESVLLKGLTPNMREWGTIKGEMKDALSGFIFSKTGRSPMILPIIMEV